MIFLTMFFFSLFGIWCINEKDDKIVKFLCIIFCHTFHQKINLSLINIQIYQRLSNSWNNETYKYVWTLLYFVEQILIFTCRSTHLVVTDKCIFLKLKKRNIWLNIFLIHVSMLSFLKVCLYKFKVHAMCPFASKLSLLCVNLQMNFKSLYKI